MMRTELAALQGEREKSVQLLKKSTAKGITYSRAGTAELKPYLRAAKKFCKILENVVFLRYFFTFTTKKMAFAKGQQRSRLRILKPLLCLFRPWSINIYQK
jgi:hypothetical protein